MKNIFKKHLFALILLSFIAITQISQGQGGPPPPPGDKGTSGNQAPGSGSGDPGVPLDSSALVLLLGAAAFIGSRKVKPTHP